MLPDRIIYALQRIDEICREVCSECDMVDDLWCADCGMVDEDDDAEVPCWFIRVRREMRAILQSPAKGEE